MTASEIADMLWPGQSVDNPTTAVKNVAYRARCIMDTICSEHIITVTHGLYHLNQNLSIYTDAGMLEILYQKAHSECNIHRKLALYQTLISYYRGDLAPCIADEHWVLATASHFHLLFLDAVKEYISLLDQTEHKSEIQRVIFHALKIEPTDGDLHYLLIRALLSQGADGSAHRLFSKAEPFLSVKQSQDLLSVLKIS
jgi:DNA-binding SARP family transcriptional activator